MTPKDQKINKLHYNDVWLDVVQLPHGTLVCFRFPASVTTAAQISIILMSSLFQSVQIVEVNFLHGQISDKMSPLAIFKCIK